MDIQLPVIWLFVNHRHRYLTHLMASIGPLLLPRLLLIDPLNLCSLSEYPLGVGDSLLPLGLLLEDIHQVINCCSRRAIFGDDTL